MKYLKGCLSTITFLGFLIVFYVLHNKYADPLTGEISEANLTPFLRELGISSGIGLIILIIISVILFFIALRLLRAGVRLIKRFIRYVLS